MTIRKATLNETQQILDYSLVVMKEATVGHVIPSKQLYDKFMVPILEDGGYYLVHTENNLIQGWVGIGRQFDQYKQEFVGVIIEMYVLPAYRKRGIAEKLCLEAMRNFKKTGFKRVQLNVFAGNHAKHLYEKIGFHDVTTTMERNL